MKKMNKWFYAFLAVAIVLVVAVATIVMMGLNKDTPDPTPDYTEGAETGVYYYDVADGEVVLSLNSGNIFSIAGPGLNKSGTYTVNGDQITFDFVRDEDGTAPAVLANGNITLTYNEVTMTFIPKVNYTVSFNTNGGSAVNSVSVLNGKLAAKPVDPTKDGHVFIGWFTAAEGGTQVDSATVMTAGVQTVYAHYEPTLTFSFVNYDGTAIYGGELRSGEVIPAPGNTPRTPRMRHIITSSSAGMAIAKA
jgi:uncharacterized repeat protein (TIGR02543 family)